VIGIALAMDGYDKYEYKCTVFTAGGFSAGVTSSSTPDGGASLGISMGFLKQDPTNISGWFVDGCGSGSFQYGSFGLTLSWAPPMAKPPYVDSRPIVGVCRLALAKTKMPYSGPSASITLGASYTHIIQKIRTLGG
jgi:hypothetical protein